MMNLQKTQGSFARPSASTDAPPWLSALLAGADVRFNGTRPWDIQVRRRSFYSKVLARWSLGLGESYVDGDWDCEQMDELFSRLLRTDIESRAVGLGRLRLLLAHWRHQVLNLQSTARAYLVAEKHYDIGNEVFEAMLDSRMIYSCAYWEHAQDLEQAQRAKLELICQKLQLRPGETLLDIGCGWGGLAQYAAQRHGVRVTGVTVSREQHALATQRCHGLPVTLLLQDYRSLQGRFDKIVSVGMFEHVGDKNYDIYFATVQRLLAPEGLFLLHTIGLNQRSSGTDPWIETYIFPNGKIPSAGEIAEHAEGKLLIEDWHNFGADYDRTLMAWWRNFEGAWPQLRQRQSARFYRLWRYYLMSCAGFFRARQGQLWQIVLSQPQRQSVYRSVRASALTP